MSREWLAVVLSLVVTEQKLPQQHHNWNLCTQKVVLWFVIICTLLLQYTVGRMTGHWVTLLLACEFESHDIRGLALPLLSHLPRETQGAGSTSSTSREWVR